MIQTILNQITWSHTAALYLGFCSGIALWWIGLCAYTDIFKGPDAKFGYNYKSSISWALLVFFSFPIVNLFSLVFWIRVTIRNKIDNIKKAEQNAKSV